MLQRFTRHIFICLLVILVVLPVISQEATPPLEMTLTATLTPSPTASLTPSPTISIAEITPELTLEPSATSSPTTTASQAELTEEATAEVTAEITEASVEETSLPALTISPSALPELTEAVEVTAVVTEASPIAVSSITPTATAGGFNLEMLRGQIKYQNRAEHSGISVSVLSMDGILLSVATTNARGIFSLPAPSDKAFVLLFEAPLHRSLRLEVNQGNRLANNLVLAGGDLNFDGCINNGDMQQLLANYELTDTPQSDINADGLTDLSDLAILTGNFDAACEIVVESTEAAQ